MEKYTWAIAIDLTEVGEENIALIESPRFNTEEEADQWYRQLKVYYANLDIIMIKYDENDNIEDTYVY